MITKTYISPLKRFFNLLQVEKKEIFTIYIYALFNGIIGLSLPLGIQAIINLISVGQVSNSWIILVALVIGGVALSGVMQVMQLSVSENIQQKIFIRSAFEFAFRIPRLKLDGIKDMYVPEMVNRFFDTLTVQKGLSKILIDFSSASFQIIFGLILLSLYHPFFIIFSIILVVFVYLIFRWTAAGGLVSSIRESSHKYEVVHWLEEVARTIETFKLAGNTDLPMERADQKVSGYLKERKSHFRTLVVQFISLVGFKVLMAAGLLIIGGLLVINQQMNIGQFVASEIIIILVLASVEKLILSMEVIYDVLTAIEKISTVTDLELENETGSVGDKVEGEGLKVELVNFSYKNSSSFYPEIKDLNLVVDAGDKVCITGPNDGGKSILLQSIAGLYQSFRGNILYNEVPFGNWATANLRDMIGDNFNSEDIFKGTILDNLLLGKNNISVDHLNEVMKIVSLDRFIAGLPHGYDTALIAGGSQLPKVIRIKLMLARSIIHKPKLMLLEDNLKLINKVERDKFLEFVNSEKCKSTVIAISDQKDIADQFDKIIKMENGTFVSPKPNKANNRRKKATVS